MVAEAQKVARDNVTTEIADIPPRASGPTCHWSLIGPVQKPPVFFDRHHPLNFQ